MLSRLNLVFILSFSFLIRYSLTIPSNAISEDDKETEVERNDMILTEEKCEAVPYKQNITVPGCKSKLIDNRYCKGQCISGYVPENGVNGKYRCSSCQPHVTTSQPITLECENGEMKTVQVEIFKECKCAQTKCHISNYSYIIDDVDGKSTKTPLTNRPCRDICRKCRRARRTFRDLRQKKELNEYLLESCRLPECKKRITQNIFERTRLQKVLKKKSCSECHTCKDRKRKRINQK